LIEWGEGVTYISIYKSKTLKYLATLPLGGLAITKDIRSLNVSEDEAETLKIKYGRAISESTDSGEVPVNEEQSSPRKIAQSELNWIIESRVDEIIKNIWSQIQASEYAQALDAGIVITGGGALLRDLPLYIKNQTGKEVRLAKAKVWENKTEIQLSPADSCVVGLTILGKENCIKEKAVIEQPRIFVDEEKKVEKKEEKKEEKKDDKKIEPKQPSFFRRIGGKFKDIVEDGASLFDESENNKKEE
jgi:cell division protein FtsA